MIPIIHIAFNVISRDIYIISFRLSICGIFIARKYNAMQNTNTDNIKENNLMPFCLINERVNYLVIKGPY